MANAGETGATSAPDAAEENIDLRAVLRTIRQPLLVLDGALDVLRANAAFHATFGTSDAETEGCKVYDLGNGQWTSPDLRRLLEEILAGSGEVTDYRVEHVFERLGRRVMVLNAYRMEGGAGGDRILLTIDDQTERERLLWELEAQREYAEKIVDASRNPFLVLDRDLKVKTANETFYRHFRVDPHETEGRLVYDLGNGQWDIPRLRELLEHVLPENNVFDDFEVEHAFEGIGRRTMVLNARKIDHQDWILLEIEDRTERRRAEAERRESEERKAFLLRLSDALRPLSDPVRIQATAVELLREKHEVMRAMYLDVAEYGDTMTPAARSELNAVPIPDRLQLSDYGPDLADAFRAGRTLSVRDTMAEAPSEAHRRAYRAIGVGAWIAAPLVKEGRLLAVVGVQSDTARDWTDTDVQLVTDLAERTWDAVERARAEAGLRKSEARFREFGDASSDALWIRDAETLDWEYLSPAFEAIYGMRRDEALATPDIGYLMSLVVPEDRDRTTSAIRGLRNGPRVYDYRIRRISDGQVRWLRTTGFPLVDADGSVHRLGGITHDMTEEKRTADRMEVLVAELQHRTRNLIGVTRALASRTLRSSRSLEDFAGRFGARLDALARVNVLLSRLEEGDRITFDELLATELNGHGIPAGDTAGGKLTLRGPRGVRLPSASVQTLALALHELLTNATKYGALSGPAGKLFITWEMSDGSAPRLRVDWRETGITVDPEIASSPGNGGYGRQLIEQALPFQLGAETSYDLGPQELRCSIVLPVPR